jgi:hypothetical protein
LICTGCDACAGGDEEGSERALVARESEVRMRAQVCIGDQSHPLSQLGVEVSGVCVCVCVCVCVRVCVWIVRVRAGEA